MSPNRIAQALTGGAGETWRLLRSGQGEPAFNMALDDLLLQSAATLGCPVLRFYGWSESAVTFGYFQKYAEIARWTALRPLIRRPTGGGLVPHDGDWTYSLIFPPCASWYSLSAEGSYRRVHEWVRAAFAKMDVSTSLAPCCRKALPGQCFAGHEKFDVLWHDRKIAGAAQRRNRNGLLIQGSIQPPPIKLVREDWERAMSDIALQEFRTRWDTLILDASFREKAERLAAEIYSQASHNQRR